MGLVNFVNLLKIDEVYCGEHGYRALHSVQLGQTFKG